MRKYAWKLLRFLKVAPFIQIFYKGILDEYGWFRSFNKKQSIDKKGAPIPWYAYSAIFFIEGRLHNKLTVFEFGAGNSTLWFSKRVKNVVSVEHDTKWFSKIKKEMPNNVELIHSDLDYDGDYCRSASKQEKKFDIIIIDGRDRNNCVHNSLDSLTKDGVIIFDNSQIEDYSVGKKFLKENGFKNIDFKGLCPCVPHSNTTSIFYKSKNCLEI